MSEQAEHHEESQVVVEMWADLGCPWCYLGKHRLQTAIAQRPDADRFMIIIRSFELNPAASREPETNAAAFIRSHGGSADDVLRAERQLQAVAHSEGLGFSLDRASANTSDLHRVLQFANDEGRGTVFFSAVQDGFFAGTLNPYAPGVLARVAETVGLDGRRVGDILAGTAYTDRVRADRNEGLELGVTGVPFVVLDRRLAASGAQPVAVYGRMLDQLAGVAPVGDPRFSLPTR